MVLSGESKPINAVSISSWCPSDQQIPTTLQSAPSVPMGKEEPYIVEEISLSDVGKMPDPQTGSLFVFHLLRALAVVGGFDD